MHDLRKESQELFSPVQRWLHDDEVPSGTDLCEWLFERWHELDDISSAVYTLCHDLLGIAEPPSEPTLDPFEPSLLPDGSDQKPTLATANNRSLRVSGRQAAQ
jgi:hypothetical protein